MPRAHKPTDPVEEPTSSGAIPEATRPGTSGTEVLLTTNRRQASNNFQRAQRAERAYRTKKRASAAREGYREARGHFKESVKQFGLGLKMTAKTITSVPYVIGEKRDARRKEGDAKRKEKAMRQKKELEEKLARQAEDEDDEATEEKGEKAEKKA